VYSTYYVFDKWSLYCEGVIHFVVCVAISDMSEKLETLHRLIEQLPELNHAVFERVIFHLARLVHINNS